MEEKKILDNIRTSTKKSLVFIIILSILAYIIFFGTVYVELQYFYNEHMVYDEHYFNCYNEKGQSVYLEYECDPELLTFLKTTEGVDTTNCEYNKYTSAYDCFINELFDDDSLFEFIIITSVCLFIILVSVYCICLSKCKFSVTENNIYGKKGSKKFDIAFSDIVEIMQKGKSIIIKTDKKKLKLSPLKNCDEIYSHIKPFVTEKPITQQVTSTVDDIKLF